jgi:hypothetical protein
MFLPEATFVFTVKVADAAPSNMVTFAGTRAAFLLLASFTTAPPAAAGPLSVTVPWEDVPPLTVVGLSAIEVSETAELVCTL